MATTVPSRSRPLYTSPKLPAPTRLASAKFLVACASSSSENCLAPWNSGADEVRPNRPHSADQQAITRKRRRTAGEEQHGFTHVPSVGGASDEPVSELWSRRALRRRRTSHAATRTAASSNAAAPAAMPATTGVGNAIRATGASNLQRNVQTTIEQSEGIGEQPAQIHRPGDVRQRI